MNKEQNYEEITATVQRKIGEDLFSNLDQNINYYQIEKI
jgi:hypothetical protein|tara:strand:+ start:345 stop:461 length:117 start_codon:yes stop_codon:yes gene_type:complete